MQILEIILFLVNILLLVFLIKSKKKHKTIMEVLLLLNIGVLVLNLGFEHSRWQLYPLYVSMILLLTSVLIYLLRFKGFRYKKVTRRITLTLSLILVVVSVISNVVLPVNEMPLPSGDLSIGTSSFVLTDKSRIETYDDGGNRRIKIQVWYPAKTTDGYKEVPWLEDGKPVSNSLAESMGLPGFILNHTELMMSSSYLDAPISDSSANYPVIKLSHGWSSLRNMHTDLAEELTSLGYIVVGIEHTYGSLATVFSDNDVSYINYDALPDTDTSEEFLGYANKLVNTYASDVSFTIDELEKMNSGSTVSIFKDKLDLDKLGLLGHSTGGGGDVSAALNDSRIKAIVGMDAWVEPLYSNEISKNLQVPAMFLRSEAWSNGKNNPNLLSLVNGNTDESLLFQIDGTVHTDFSMAYMFDSPLAKQLKITGDNDSVYLVSILKTMITNFFDNNLREKNTIDLSTMDQKWDIVSKINKIN